MQLLAGTYSHLPAGKRRPTGHNEDGLPAVPKFGTTIAEIRAAAPLAAKAFEEFFVAFKHIKDNKLPVLVEYEPFVSYCNAYLGQKSSV